MHVVPTEFGKIQTKFSLACTEFCKCRGEGNCDNVGIRVPQEELSCEEEDGDDENDVE